MCPDVWASSARRGLSCTNIYQLLLCFTALVLHNQHYPHTHFTSDFHCEGKYTVKKLCIIMCWKGHKTQKNALKLVKSSLKVSFYSFAFKSQNIAQVVENVAHTCIYVCLSLLETLPTPHTALCPHYPHPHHTMSTLPTPTPHYVHTPHTHTKLCPQYPHPHHTLSFLSPPTPHYLYYACYHYTTISDSFNSLVELSESGGA